MRSFTSASFAEKLTWFELAVMGVSVLVMSILTSLIAMLSIRESILLSAEFTTGSMKATTVEAGQLLQLVDEEAWVTSYNSIVESAAGSYPFILADSYWIILLVASITIPAALHPMLSRIQLQLPALMFRAAITPSRVVASTLSLSFLAALPITVSPLAASMLALNWAGLHVDVSQAWGSLAGLYAYTILFAPLVYSSIYILTGRFDISILSLLLLSEALFLLVSLYGLTGSIIALAAAALVVSYSAYRSVYTRWGGI